MGIDEPRHNDLALQRHTLCLGRYAHRGGGSRSQHTPITHEQRGVGDGRACGAIDERGAGERTRDGLRGCDGGGEAKQGNAERGEASAVRPSFSVPGDGEVDCGMASSLTPGQGVDLNAIM